MELFSSGVNEERIFYGFAKKYWTKQLQLCYYMTCKNYTGMAMEPYDAVSRVLVSVEFYHMVFFVVKN